MILCQCVKRRAFDTGFDGRSRAFMKFSKVAIIVFLCDTFRRGPSRSVPAGEIVNQINALVRVRASSLGLISLIMKGLPGSLNLTALVRKILKLVPELRLRLSSLDQWRWMIP